MMRPNHIPTIILFLVLTFILIPSPSASAVERFPPPDFDSGHVLPSPTEPPARNQIYEYLDAFLLLAALIVATYLAFKNRSRRAIFILMMFSLAYFGFWRKGCICSIGAIQNISLALFATSYAVPLVALIFFLLPLVFTLFFGRTFCAAICPLGAIQDFALVRPIKVPIWLDHALRSLGYLYLGAAVLLAATDSAFIICQYDPFVGFFRLTGSLNILVLGGCILIIALFVGRPYCRFLCPYGVILRQLARVARHHVTITPENCIQCLLCEDACPFNAINKPTTEQLFQNRNKAKVRLGILLALWPVFIVVGGLLGSFLATPLSRAHRTVRLAEQVYSEQTGAVKETTEASDAFRGTGRDPLELYADATSIQQKFVWGSWAFGAFVGLMIGTKLIYLSVLPKRTDFQPDRAACFSCGRCFSYCPIERERSKKSK